jgi:hypothetical protein
MSLLNNADQSVVMDVSVVGCKVGVYPAAAMLACA